MKENVSNFFKKVDADPALGKRLEKLRQSHIEQLILLAKEAGFEIIKDDFIPNVQALKDEHVDSVNGGWNPYMETDIVTKIGNAIHKNDAIH